MMAYKKYEMDMTITTDNGKAHISSITGASGAVTMLAEVRDENCINHCIDLVMTPRQAREIAAALVHYAKELEKGTN